MKILIFFSNLKLKQFLDFLSIKYKFFKNFSQFTLLLVSFAVKNLSVVSLAKGLTLHDSTYVSYPKWSNRKCNGGCQDLRGRNGVCRSTDMIYVIQDESVLEICCTTLCLQLIIL